jgi:hypothetical protein
MLSDFRLDDEYDPKKISVTNKEVKERFMPDGRKQYYLDRVNPAFYEKEDPVMTTKLEDFSSKRENNKGSLVEKLPNIIQYKYDEDTIMEEFQEYLDALYSDHYVTENNIECFDAWIALGDSSSTFRDNVIKYLWRYGKKEGKNKKDLHCNAPLNIFI